MKNNSKELWVPSKELWVPSSYRDRDAKHQPPWPDASLLAEVFRELLTKHPLVTTSEVDSLRDQLASVCEGNAILLQAGKCAESLNESTDNILSDFKVLLQMTMTLAYSTGMPVVKIGRWAGQFAKPRSSPTEERNGVVLHAFMGEIVNGHGFNEQDREPDPNRLLRAYYSAASTLNLLRSFAKGGDASLEKVHSWNQEFVRNSPEGQDYEVLANKIAAAISFMRSCGIDPSEDSKLYSADFYTSHEALILQYEEALTRLDSLSNKYYDLSAHMLWCGERTRQLDGAHIEFLRGIQNPIGCKIGPSMTPAELDSLCEILNPERIPGRLTLITRFGVDNIDSILPSLIKAVQKAGHKVVWACDPMHGNTFTSESTGLKTRDYETVLRETKKFFKIHEKMGTIAGGVHVESTGSKKAKECVGGPQKVKHSQLRSNRETKCDPQFNAYQSIGYANKVSKYFPRRRVGFPCDRKNKRTIKGS